MDALVTSLFRGDIVLVQVLHVLLGVSVETIQLLQEDILVTARRERERERGMGVKSGTAEKNTIIQEWNSVSDSR